LYFSCRTPSGLAKYLSLSLSNCDSYMCVRGKELHRENQQRILIFEKMAESAKDDNMADLDTNEQEVELPEAIAPGQAADQNNPKRMLLSHTLTRMVH